MQLRHKLLMQEPNLCDFEQWKEWKALEPKQVKLKMRLDMEAAKKKGSHRRIENALEFGDKLLKSGLLYESTKQHLNRALLKHQAKQRKDERRLAEHHTQFLQVDSQPSIINKHWCFSTSSWFIILLPHHAARQLPRSNSCEDEPLSLEASLSAAAPNFLNC